MNGAVITVPCHDDEYQVIVETFVLRGRGAQRVFTHISLRDVIEQVAQDPAKVAYVLSLLA